LAARTNPIDAHVGNRVRVRRVLLGLTQEKLAQALGLTFQQVQKYERGTNRISSGRLFQLAQALDVPVSFFYVDLPGTPASGTATPLEPTADTDTMSRQETMELVRAYYRIPELPVRKRVFELVKTIAGPTPGAKRRGRPPKVRQATPDAA
jgi:transcriptional regulator with XRE-family HTH domain